MRESRKKFVYEGFDVQGLSFIFCMRVFSGGGGGRGRGGGSKQTPYLDMRMINQLQIVTVHFR